MEIEALFALREHFLGYLRRRVDAITAEDILQLSYLRVLQRGAQVRDPSRAVGWFYSILRNAVVDHYRHAHRARSFENDMEYDLPAPEPDGEVAPDVAERTLSLIPQLPPLYREVLHAVYVEGRSIASFARCRGISRNSATVRVHRARHALRSLVDAGQHRETGQPDLTRARPLRELRKTHAHSHP